MENKQSSKSRVECFGRLRDNMLVSKTTVLRFFITLAVCCTLVAQNHKRSPLANHRTLLYVGDSTGTTISVIDLDSLKLVDQITLGERVHGLAIEATGERLFATVESDHTLRIIDTKTDQQVATIALTGRPNQCAVTPDGKLVVVPIRDGDSVDIVDAAQRKVVKVLPLKGPHNAVAYPESNRFAFVSSMGDREIALVDLSTLAYSATIPVGGVPRPFVIDAQGQRIFVAESNLHGFTIVSIPEKKVLERVEIPSIKKTPHPRPFEPIDTLTHGLALSPDGDELWVTSLIDDSIYVYDIGSKKVTQRLPTGDGPNWVTFSPDGRFVCVSNSDSHDVSIFDAKRHTELARIKTGGVPKRILAADTPQAPHIQARTAP